MVTRRHQHRWATASAWIRFAAVLLLLSGGAGCASSPDAAKPAAGAEQAAKPAAVPTGDDYIIGAGDVLEILVWRNTDLSRVVTVRPDGKISLPLINDVQAAGVTPMALKEQIAKRLKEFKELPEVSVIVNEARSQAVYVLGQVVRPGPYHLVLGQTTALQIISAAGGFTPFADRNGIVVIRKGPPGGKEQRIRVSLKSVLNGESGGDIPVNAGDTIIVP